MGSKLWEIRERYGDRMGGYGERGKEDYSGNPEMMKAYECGKKEVLEDIMGLLEEMVGETEHHMGERGMSAAGYYTGSFGSEPGTSGFGERRRRDSMGRYR